MQRELVLTSTKEIELIFFSIMEILNKIKRFDNAKIEHWLRLNGHFKSGIGICMSIKNKSFCCLLFPVSSSRAVV